MLLSQNDLSAASPLLWAKSGVYTVLAGAPRTVTDKLQLNAAARVITGTRKFDRGLGQILHDQLHWIDVPDRVLFKLAVAVHQCLNGHAPRDLYLSYLSYRPYLSEHCIPVSSADTRRRLRSANRHLLAVPRFRLNICGRRAFSVAGPMSLNSVPEFIRDPTSSIDCFMRLFTCSRVTRASSALGVLNDYALYKSTHLLAHSTVYLLAMCWSAQASAVDGSAAGRGRHADPPPAARPVLLVRVRLVVVVLHAGGSPAEPVHDERGERRRRRGGAVSARRAAAAHQEVRHVGRPRRVPARRRR